MDGRVWSVLRARSKAEYLLRGVRGRRQLMPLCMIWNATSPVLWVRSIRFDIRGREAGGVVPSGLVRGTQATPIIAVEELSGRPGQSPRKGNTALQFACLMEPNVVPKVGVTIELDVASVRSPTALHVAPKDVNDAMLDLLCNLAKVHVVATARGAFDLKLLSEVLMESLERLDQEEVGRQPNGPWVAMLEPEHAMREMNPTSPVGVTAEHAALRITGPIFNAEVLPVDVHVVRMIFMIERKP